MKKLTQIMNEIREYLHTFEELKDKACIIESWIELEDNIKNILEEKENKTDNLIDYVCPHCKGDLGVKEIKEQIIKCGCGDKYYMSEDGVLTPIKEVDC